MIYRQLGRTGIDISLLSLGSGGQNPFGQNTGIPESEIHSLIHRALDLGINPVVPLRALSVLLGLAPPVDPN